MIEPYKTKHFRIEELVSPEVFADRGEKAFELLDVRLLITLDQLRERYGPMTINNWIWKPESDPRCRTESGLRTPGMKHFSPYSQHTFGRAADCLFAHKTADQVRSEILSNPDLFPYIMSVELGVSWLHFDVRNCDRIKTYTP